MGYSFFIAAEHKLKTKDLIDYLYHKKQEVDYIRKDKAHIFYKHGFSARGLELTETKNGFELKLKFLSNTFDYNLCNNIAPYICKYLDGTLTNEEGKQKKLSKLLKEKKIFELIVKDVEVVFEALKKEKEVEIYGPVRPFIIGKRIRPEILLLSNEKYKQEKADKLFSFILNSQYPPANFKPFHDMMEDSIHDVKVYYGQIISNNHDVVIEKVKKYFISELQGDISICLSIKDIISILPEEWKLLDDYTILACKLPDNRWNTFVEAAKKVGKLIDK